MSFLMSHWLGKLPLGITLWINLVALLIVISYAELFLLSKLAADPTQLINLTLVSLFITRLIIFPWQLIGLLRAIEFDYIEHKNFLKNPCSAGICPVDDFIYTGLLPRSHPGQFILYFASRILLPTR